ncbi:hypothetical protein LCGC14_1090430 [marine sediment metagenome]|uniref:Uncharacterized protein n=1 Tax=marine sediment metagenome TaxID=412755 RepID=A0A0F9MGZ4_9ZZZZ
MKQEVKIDQADYTIFILVRDTSGNAKTALAFGDIDLAYARVETDNDVTTTDVAPVDLVTPLLTDPHLDWGFLEVAAADHPGLYRLDIADAVFATGAWSSVVTLTGAGLEPSHCEFMLVPEEPYSRIVPDAAGVAPTAVENRQEMDNNSTELAKIGTIPALDGAGQTIGAAIGKLADDNAGATFDAGTDSLNKIRDDRTLPAADYTIVGDLGTVQSADNNTILSHADYGNAKLVRSTTPANKLDVSATGEAGLDFDNIKDATAPHALTNITVPVVTTNTDTAIELAKVPKSDSNVSWNATALGAIEGEVDDAIATAKLDHLVQTAAAEDEVADNSIIARLAATEGDWSEYNDENHSLEAIRVRGDAAWITGGGGGISDILNVQSMIPNEIDLANTVTIRLALGLTNMLDDLPSTVEITPGTITIDRKAIGGTSWTNIENAVACSEAAGLIYYDEVFDTGAGYLEGDSIRITFKSQKITVAANDYEITDATGWIFQTSIRQTMVGTNGANTTVPDAAGVAPTADEVRDAILDDATRFSGGNIDVAISSRGTADAGDAMNLAADAIKAVSYDETSAFPLKADDSAATQIARVGADGDTLETLSDQIDDVPTVAEFNARTIVSAGYVVVGDTIAGVTTATNLTNAPTSGDLTATMKTSVNTEVLDVLNTDTFAEPGQEAPPATTSLVKKIGYLYKFLRNKIITDATGVEVYNDAGAVVDQKSTISDDGTDFTRGKFGSGP